MKTFLKTGLPVLILFGGIIACKKNDPEKDNIAYQYVNKKYVIIRDIKTLQNSNDEISVHIDSIIKGLIKVEFISTGTKNFDLTGDGTFDISFEIIDLNKFNPNGVPDTLDSLAARVIPLTVQILDNSTYGYPDALDDGAEITEKGNWTNNRGVLGTFLSAGQFKGKGEKYLGIRIPQNNQYQYGWIRLYCSQHNDTLKVLDFAYNKTGDRPIMAGQKE